MFKDSQQVYHLKRKLGIMAFISLQNKSRFYSFMFLIFNEKQGKKNKWWKESIYFCNLKLQLDMLTYLDTFQKKKKDTFF